MNLETLFAKTRRQQRLTDDQLDLVIGSILGDAHLVRTTCGYAFRVNHGLAQISYVEWKYEILTPFVRTKPRISGKCYYFRTISHPIFSDLHTSFYEGRNKIVPADLLKARLNPFILAVWIMDDGSRDGRQLRINSQSFSKRENLFLQDILDAKLGIKSALNRDKDKYRLRIKDQSMKKLVQLVEPHIIPSMLYKLLP